MILDPFLFFTRLTSLHTCRMHNCPRFDCMCVGVLRDLGQRWHERTGKRDRGRTQFEIDLYLFVISEIRQNNIGFHPKHEFSNAPILTRTNTHVTRLFLRSKLYGRRNQASASRWAICFTESSRPSMYLRLDWNSQLLFNAFHLWPGGTGGQAWDKRTGRIGIPCSQACSSST